MNRLQLVELINSGDLAGTRLQLANACVMRINPQSDNECLECGAKSSTGHTLIHSHTCPTEKKVWKR